MNALPILLAATITTTARAPRDATPIGRAELAAVLRDGHFAVFGSFPSRRRLAIAWAQCALESGQGARSRGHNIGSIGAPAGAPSFLVAGARFRVYGDFIEAARDYWSVVGRSQRALACFDAGDAACAARALHGFYHRTDPEVYGAAMRSLAWTFRRDVERDL